MSKYKKNYLTRVAVRIEFPEISGITEDESSIETFKEIFEDEFPAIAFENYIIKDYEFIKNVWIFQRRDKEIQLTNSFIELIYDEGRYEGSEELFRDVDLLFEALNENEIEDAIYMGLRYVNEITPKEKVKDWSEWIDSDLLNFNFKPDNSDFIRGLSKYEYRIDKYFLSMQYGQYNLSYPSTHIQDDFILDYEAYVTSDDTRYLRKYVRKMHEIIIDFFETSIRDGFRKDLEMIEE